MKIVEKKFQIPNSKIVVLVLTGGASGVLMNFEGNFCHILPSLSSSYFGQILKPSSLDASGREL